jgi:hypothetical protein
VTAPKIDAYQFGKIVIDGKTHHRDVIVLQDRVIGNWWRIEGHTLALEDLGMIVDDPPEVLIIGQGAHRRMVVPRQTLRGLEESSIEVIALATSEACETYNQLRGKKKAAAALHLTC